MSRVETTTNFRDSFGTDLGKKLVTKDYLISVYPEIGDNIVIPPELWVWGQAYNGKLGVNTSSGYFGTPVTTFAGGTNWKQNGSNHRHAALIKTDGTLWTWGRNQRGQLGINDATDRNTPITTMVGGTNWKQVSAGYRATAAIKTDGSLWTWGYAAYGAIGRGSTAGNQTPSTIFAGGSNWKQVSCGNAFSAAIKTDGTLWTWGYGNSGRLGNNNTTNRSTPVTTFAGGTNWKQVSAGKNHAAAIKTDGTLWVWGNNLNARLGINDANDRVTPVTTFAGGTNWKQVSGGDTFTGAIKTDGTLWVWGWNGSNNLGLGSGNTTIRLTPVTTFAGGTNWKSISCGVVMVMAIKTDGTLWTWGENGSRQLGNNNFNNVGTPITTFAGGNNWKEARCGELFSTAIKSVDFSPF